LKCDIHAERLARARRRAVYIDVNIRLPSFGYNMPLYIKDPEVDRLAERLASLRHASKTEVVRQALQRELEREEGKPSLVEKGVAFVQALKTRAQPAAARAADKAFIDSLYDGS
jgi:antitoxin VapB